MAQSTSTHLPPQPSASAPSSPSPSQSIDPQGPITVETLISYLVAAKRSLSSIHYVHRATTILAEARASIESTAALLARTAFLRRSLQSQLKILRGIQFELEGATNAIQVEFQNSIRELDAAGKKLDQSIQLLKQTKIEHGFKPPPSLEGSGETPNKETLHDFVEEKPVEDLKDAMKDVIDSVQDQQQDVDRSIRHLEDELQTVNELLDEKDPGVSTTSSDWQPPNMPVLLKELEDYAHSMAQSLESLVKHFDLCATAIKHTEGAGDAVLRKYRAGSLPEDVDVENLEGPAEPMSHDEREEMLGVLSTDAAEVDDVVVEIQEHATEMEGNLTAISNWRDRAEAAHGDIATAFSHLEIIGSRLHNLVAESSRHASRWADDRARIEDGIAGIEELCETYDNFLHAYDRLIVEAARRRSVKKQMERIVDEAQGRLDALHDEDLHERQLFRQEQGDFLPSDIWEGLHLGPARYGVQRVDEVREGREEWLSVPELPRDIVEGALRRLKEQRL
jgi:autophagy-related protein 17